MKMSEPLRCSIVINTYNRQPYLEKLLTAFHHLTYDHFEVIVVNGPSTDGTTALLARYAGRIKVVDCPEANLSRSRNLGIAAAAGEIVVFIDDDALPDDPDWLNKIVHAFENDEAGIVGAAGGDAFHRDTAYYEFQGGLTSDYALQVFRQEEIGDQILDGKRWAPRTVGCNSAFRRSVLQQIGGFDEYFIYYLDESDVCLRLARAGYQIRHLANCPVRHYPAQSPHGAPFLRNRRIITQSDTYYCLKNGADGFIKRFLKTLWLAPQKHFVREAPNLWKIGQISTGDLFKFVGQWLSGLISGLRGGLSSNRRNHLPDIPPPDFLPFVKNVPSQKLRICLLTQSTPPDSKIGGVARYTYNLAKGLHELGHEVHIVCASEQPVRRDSLEFTLHGIPASDYVGKILFPYRPVLNRHACYALAVAHKLQTLREQGLIFDVAHTSNWGLEGLTLPLMQMCPFLLVLVSPLAQVIETEGWTYNDDLRACVALDRWQIERADVVCCPSWGVLESYRTKMGLDFEQVTVHKVQLGIMPALSKSQNQMALPRGEPRLLFVGRLEHRKGAHILLEILPDLLTQYPEWRCDLVGDNQTPDNSGVTLKEQFLEKHRHATWLNRIHFHGTVTDEALDDFYSRCDLFVAPSLFESFGLVYLEAMQYAKAVVGCRVAGIPEIVSDEVDGLLVEPNNPKALAEALDRLMGDDGLREKLGRAGFKKVHGTFNYVAMAERMLPHYFEVIAKKGPECENAVADSFIQI